MDLQLALTDEENKDVDGNDLYRELQDLLLPPSVFAPIDVLNYLHKNEILSLYPNIVIALKLLLTIPVSVASAERSFSKLKIIKNYHRSTMTQDRLNDLAIISIEKDIAKEIDPRKIIQQFTSIKARKININ